MPSEKKIDLLSHPAGTMLVPEFHRGFHREPVTGSAVFRYLSSLRPDVLHDQASVRGLHFGVLAVQSGAPMEIQFTHTMVNERTVTAVVDGAVSEAFRESGLGPHVLYSFGPRPGMSTHLYSATVPEEIFRELSSDRKERRAEHIAPGHRTLVELHHFDSFPYRAHATCQEGADALFAAMQALGLRTTPAHFANMGTVQHSALIDFALLWHDAKNDTWFGEILWETTLMKSVWWSAGVRAHEHLPMGGTREAWSFASRDRPRVSVNCLPVAFLDVSVTTAIMETMYRRSLTDPNFWR